jgi:hypothetical protein
VLGEDRAAGGVALLDLLLETVSVIGDLGRHFHGLFYTDLGKCKVETDK